MKSGTPAAEFNQDRALGLLLRGTTGETGRGFFRALVRTAATAFQADCAWVTEYRPGEHSLRSIAFWHHGQFVDDYEYKVTNTPCGEVVEKADLIVFPDRLVELYPADDDLKKANAVSYMGAPMLDAQGAVIGHFAVMYSGPLQVDPHMTSVFELFALRASAELQRVRAECRLQEVSLQAEVLRAAVHELPDPGGIIGESQPVRHLRESIARVAPTDATVLITGETGTGKELVARAIHLASARARKPLIRVNCAVIPANLIESEFFGHERGAFTGAISRREGRFALANGGTIFLDEVGEMPIDLQAKLLRVLQEGEFEPLGSSTTRKVDVRVIAATNRDLAARVHNGNFREDLYYRLCVFPLHSPPLRKRGNDIAMLAHSFARQFACKMGFPEPRILPQDHLVLASYHWPGNVRELQNVIERAIILGGGHGRLALAQAMPGQAQKQAGTNRAISVPQLQSQEGIPSILTQAELKELERQNIERALAASGGKVAGNNGAAALMGIPPSTLASRMKLFGIRPGAPEQ